MKDLLRGKKRLLQRGGLRVFWPSGIAYLLHDQFLTDDAAPLTTPRSAEPGPGRSIVDADTGNRYDISGGKLRQATGGGFTDPKMHWDDGATGFTRAAGLLLRWNMPQYVPSLYWGMFYGAPVATTNIASAYNATQYSNSLGNISGVVGNFVNGSQATQYYVARPAGFYNFVVGGASFCAPSLVLADWRGNNATLYPGAIYITGIGTTQQIASEIAVWQLATPFDADYGIAIVNATGVASGTAYASATPDSIHVLTIALPGSPSSGDYVEVRFRIVDTDNYMRGRVAWSGSQWDYTLDEVSAGTPTALQTKANVGSVTAIIQRAYYYNYDAWTLVGNTATKTGALITDATYLNDGSAIYAQGVTVSRYECYNVFDARYNALDAYPATAYGYLSVGDSKTENYGWQVPLGKLIRASSRLYAYEVSYDMGHGGYTVANGAAAVAADLAARDPAVAPSVILCNYGANDVAALPAEATWIADYQTIIDAINVKWPSALVYIVKPWRRNYAVNCDTLAGWIDTLVASRAFAHVGHDERVWLEGGDDGATMSSDGIHYSAAGLVECANQWATVLGY